MMIAETETRSWTPEKVISRLMIGEPGTALVEITQQREEELLDLRGKLQ